METTYNFLLDLALILLTTKILGLVTRRYNMPQVVGALLAGLLMGPACHRIAGCSGTSGRRVCRGIFL